MIYVYNKETDGIGYSVAVQDDQVLATTFSFEELELKSILQRLPQDAPFQVLEKSNQFLASVLNALEVIFNGRDREDYAFKIDLSHLSSHTQKVLNCTRLVPVGYVTTYGAVAKAVGGCARSVGRVEASNPVPLLIPCHRVVCSDLSVGGYGYGEQVKLEVLQREKRGYKEPKKLKVDGGELALFPTEFLRG